MVLGRRMILLGSDLARIHLSMRNRPYQANRLLAVVASMYSFAERLGLVADGCNPAARIERFPEARRERFLTMEELARLGEAFRRFENDGRFREGIAALRLLLFTGARLREILHLRWEHVDREWGLLFLPDSKTGKKTIFLNASALAVLGSLERIGDCVIPGADPNLPRADLKKPWAAVREAATLPGLRIHDLRHSFASVGVGAGLGLPIVGSLPHRGVDDLPLRASRRRSGPACSGCDRRGYFCVGPSPSGCVSDHELPHQRTIGDRSQKMSGSSIGLDLARISHRAWAYRVHERHRHGFLPPLDQGGRACARKRREDDR